MAIAAPLGGQSLADFYAARGDRPFWLGEQSGDASQILFHYLSSAEADGLNSKTYRVAQLARALRAAWGG